MLLLCPQNETIIPIDCLEMLITHRCTLDDYNFRIVGRIENFHWLK